MLQPPSGFGNRDRRFQIPDFRFQRWLQAGKAFYRSDFCLLKSEI
jgi:hypothetical protein